METKEAQKYNIPENATYIKCNACRKEITFIKNEKGNFVPVTKEGTNHFIDCPFSYKFRKLKRKNNEIANICESQALTSLPSREPAEFVLSDKIIAGDDAEWNNGYISALYVKEFIKRLKQIISKERDISDFDEDKIFYEIDKLVGKKLSQ
jgi:hypothetical protein